MSYAELQVTSDFSLLRGASSAEELFAVAALLGIPALGITDRNSLAGIVRAHEAAKVTGVGLVVGCRLDLTDFPSLLIYPTDRAAYGRLCRLLTLEDTCRQGQMHSFLSGCRRVERRTPCDHGNRQARRAACGKSGKVSCCVRRPILLRADAALPTE